jgi:hypothetical protein
MTALDLFQQLQHVEVVLTPYPDGTLRYKAPKGTLTPALLAEIRQHKDELHGLLEALEERAAIAEYCAGLSRAAAEALAWQCGLGEILGQTFTAPAPVHSRGNETDE